MGRHTKEYNEGYQAAVEALKKELAGQSQQGGSGDDQNLPDDMTSPQETTGGKGSKSGKDKKDNQSQQGSGNQGGGNSDNSRTNPNDSSQGIVRPEDCCSNNSGVENVPGTAGGFFDKNEGDKLAQSEGYAKEGGSEDKVADEWKDAALKAANKLPSEPGNAWGKLKSAIDGMYKVTTDWKKALKYIVGRSVNDAEHRQAYANKNILISQDRIARTDKDKFDNMDYLLAVIDTSASITDDKLKRLLSEVYGIALAKKPMKIVIMQCDTKVQDIAVYNTLSEFNKNIKFATAYGRGGTDMGDVWRVLRTDKRFSRSKPDLTIIFTDSDSNDRQYPRERKHMNHLVWCILDSPSFTLKYPDNMTKIIHLKSEDIK